MQGLCSLTVGVSVIQYNLHVLVTALTICTGSAHVSTKDSLMSETMADGCWSPSLKTLSITDSSVLVVSRPQNALQSLTTIPAPITSLPRFIVPAYTERYVSAVLVT